LRSVCIDESMNTLLGYLTNIECFKLDDYWTVRKASNKEYQLKIAHCLGLNIPNTLITNHPPAVKAFYESNKKNIITKMQSQFSIWKNKKEHVLFTNIITPDHLSNMDGLDQCPMIFQPYIKKKFDIRATIVGEKVFCAAIDSNVHPNMNIDWRKRGLETLEDWFAYRLPGNIEDQLIRLAKRLGLKYGAADLIITPQEEYVFLEINPSGEFYWMDEYTNLNISEAISNQLMLMH
jgi:glutathione synthase/RimK-type ligase-like ATP-grasp enzyme